MGIKLVAALTIAYVSLLSLLGLAIICWCIESNPLSVICLVVTVAVMTTFMVSASRSQQLN